MQLLEMGSSVVKGRHCVRSGTNSFIDLKLCPVNFSLHTVDKIAVLVIEILFSSRGSSRLFGEV